MQHNSLDPLKQHRKCPFLCASLIFQHQGYAFSLRLQTKPYWMLCCHRIVHSAETKIDHCESPSVPNARDKYMFFFKMYLNISIYLTGSVYTRVLLENFRAENQEINKRGLTI